MERQCVVEGTIQRNYYLSDPFAPGTLFQVGGRLGVVCQGDALGLVGDCGPKHIIMVEFGECVRGVRVAVRSRTIRSHSFSIKLFTFRESPPAHPKTATFAKCTGYRELSVCALCLSTGGREERRLVKGKRAKTTTMTTTTRQESISSPLRSLALGASCKPLGTIVEPSWRQFGSLLGPLGALLGPSWGALGALLGPSCRRSPPNRLRGKLSLGPRDP